MSTIYSDRIAGVETSTAIKAPVKAATTGNIVLSGVQSIDGVTPAAGARVLVKDQTTASENGIYVVASGAWARAIDFNGERDVAKGTQVYVTSGLTYQGLMFAVETENPVVGTAISFRHSTVDYATVAAFVADVAAGYTAVDGTVITAGPVQFVASAGLVVTGIPGGWLPFGEYASPNHFDTLTNAIESGYPLDWGNDTYEVTSTITATLPGSVKWKANGATISYTGSAAQYAVHITVPLSADFVIDGRITCDGGASAYTCWAIDSAAAGADAYTVWPNFFAYKLSAYNWRRAATTFTGGDGIMVRGGFYQVDLQFPQAIKGRMADGAHVFGSEGVFGITTLSLGAFRPRHIKIENAWVQDIKSENPAYPFDQDGIRIFQNLGTDRPDGPTCLITNTTSIDVANRTLKLHSAVSPTVRGVTISKDNDRMGRDSSMLFYTGTVTVVAGETLTQASSGASAEVLDDGGGILSYTGTQEVYLTNTTGTFDEAGAVVGSTSGSIGVPDEVHINMSANPEIDFQQSPGILSDVDFRYNGFSNELIALLSYRDDFKYGGMIIDNVRGIISNTTAAQYGAAFYIRGNAMTVNSDMRASVSNVNIIGSDLRYMVKFNPQDGGRNVLSLDNLSANTVEAFVINNGDPLAAVAIQANNCTKLEAPLGAFLVDDADSATLNIVNCHGFSEATEGFMVLDGNNPTLELKDNSPADKTARIRNIEGITYHYANVGEGGTEGVDGGFQWRGWGTGTDKLLLTLNADQTAEFYGALTAPAFEGTGVQQSATDVTAGRVALVQYAYSPGNLLGTVSESAGVPTGAVIERGSNVDGEYVRYADGTQICWRDCPTQTASTAVGSVFTSAGDLLSFPAAFIAEPAISISVIRETGSIGHWAGTVTATTTQFNWRLMTAVTGATGSATMMATGRWF